MKKILIIIITICFLLSLFLFYYFFKNNKKIIYSYQIDQDINYKVHLFDNSFIDESTLNENEMYITELIKNIDINFNYNFLGSKNIYLDYSYEIKGTIISKYINDQKIVWTKKYQLLYLIKKKDSKININETINLDFVKFLKEVEEFRKNFTLSIDTVFNIEFIVSVKDDNKLIDNKFVSLISIPLGVQAFSITNDYLDKENKDIIIKNNNYFYSFIPFIIGIILLIVFYKKIFNIKTKTKYIKKLNKILKDYNDIIIETETKFDLKNYKVIKVKNINEMIDLEDELRIPINLYKEEDMATFTLLSNNIIYIYILEE